MSDGMCISPFEDFLVCYYFMWHDEDLVYATREDVPGMLEMTNSHGVPQDVERLELDCAQ